jgi:hypothetical protein
VASAVVSSLTVGVYVGLSDRLDHQGA